MKSRVRHKVCHKVQARSPSKPAFLWSARPSAPLLPDRAEGKRQQKRQRGGGGGSSSSSGWRRGPGAGSGGAQDGDFEQDYGSLGAMVSSHVEATRVFTRISRKPRGRLRVVEHDDVMPVVFGRAMWSHACIHAFTCCRCWPSLSVRELPP